MFLLVSGLTAVPLQAQDIVYVTAFTGGTATGCPLICDVQGSYSTFGSTELATAPGIPSRSKSTYGFSSDFSWSMKPTLNVPGGVYKIEIANPTNNASTNVIISASTTDGDLSPETQNSPVFDRAHPQDQWHLFGYITNKPGVTEPKITFTVVSGTVNNSGNRLYLDAFKFTEVNDCLGVAAPVVVNGPLANNQEYVIVNNVDPAAEAITVYLDGTEWGKKTTGIVAGANTVPVFPLFSYSRITATQTINGCESEPSSPAVVGSGANPAVKAFLSFGRNTNSPFEGPIGAPATSFTSTYTMKASGLAAGSQSAPQGGQDLFPGQCWQAVTFDHSSDWSINPNDNATLTPEDYDPFAALDALVFAIDAFQPDTGPYDIYIDRIMNGDVVIEDFESYEVGDGSIFNNPNTGTIPNPALTYLPGENSTVVSSENSFDGTKALRIRWQWLNDQPARWARIRANRITGKTFPQIDTSKPVTIHYLVLPIGETQAKETYPVVPQSQTKGIGQSVTFTVSAEGDGPFFYQWNYNGSPIDGATSTSYTKNDLQIEDSGVYTVQVIGLSCYMELSATLTVTDVVEPPTLNYSVDGNQITLTWEGSFTLQSKESIDDTWTDVTSSGSHQEALNSSTTKFFRLRQ